MFEYMKHFVFFVAMFFIFSAESVSADIFEVHFFYDSAKDEIRLDKKVPQSISLNKEKDISVPNFNEQFSLPGSFEFLFFNAMNLLVDEKQFSPQEGAFTIEVPYYSGATKFVLRRSNSQEDIESYDISGLARCNLNGICEYEKGETRSECISDCVGKTTKFSSETQKVLMANGGIIKDPKTGEVILRGTTAPVDGDTMSNPTQSEASRGLNVVMLAIGVGVFFLVVIGAFIIYRLKQRNKRYGL